MECVVLEAVPCWAVCGLREASSANSRASVEDLAAIATFSKEEYYFKPTNDNKMEQISPKTKTVQLLSTLSNTIFQSKPLHVLKPHHINLNYNS